MSFTARHYNEVARIIREATARARDRAHLPMFKQHCAGQEIAVKHIAEDLRRMFAADNPRFDATRFDMACEPKEPTK